MRNRLSVSLLEQELSQAKVVCEDLVKRELELKQQHKDLDAQLDIMAEAFEKLAQQYLIVNERLATLLDDEFVKMDNVIIHIMTLVS